MARSIKLWAPILLLQSWIFAKNVFDSLLELISFSFILSLDPYHYDKALRVRFRKRALKALVLWRFIKVVLKYSTVIITWYIHDNTYNRMSCFLLNTPPPIPTVRPIVTLGKLFSIFLAAVTAEAVPHLPLGRIVIATLCFHPCLMSSLLSCGDRFSGGSCFSSRNSCAATYSITTMQIQPMV